MDWIKCEIITDNLEHTMAGLAALNIYEYEIVENFDKVTRQLGEMEAYWDFVDEEKLRGATKEEKLVVYLADEEESREKIVSICRKLEQQEEQGLAAATFAMQQLQDEDWVNNWKQYFKRLDISENIVVVPIWEKETPKDKIVIKMDPGMIFGTGSHATTQLCMRELEEHISGGEKVLDLGCGSGILSILSMLLGADHALGVDIDPGARKIVEQNCKDNGAFVEVMVGDLLQDEHLKQKIAARKYDLVVANIVADVIIDILPLVKSCLKKGHVFICSGIIEDRIKDVRNALEAAGFSVTRMQMEGEWAVFTTAVE